MSSAVVNWLTQKAYSSPITFGTAVFGLLSVFYLVFIPPSKLNSNNGVPVIKNRFGGLGALDFYNNRYTFLSKVMTKDPRHPHHGIAKFNLFRKVVYTVGTTDERMLRDICLCPDLSFSQGNNYLFAGIPGAKQKGLIEGEMDKEERQEMKQLAAAISPQRLNNMRPALVDDALHQWDTWVGGPGGTSGTVDLQQSYYPLIFRYTVRLMGMTEYATDEPALRRLMKAFWATQNNSDFFTTIMPWLLQPRLINRAIGAFKLWNMVRLTLSDRVRSTRREDDFAQEIIDQGLPPAKISRWVIGGLIAGILNTIGTGAYTIAWIGASEELQNQARSELVAALRRFAEERGDDYEDLKPQQRLDRVTLEQWETDAFKTLHMCFKESIRFLLTNSLNRYYPGPGRDLKGNLRPRLTIGGYEIEDDVYITISPSANLHDADSFPDPWTFDPTRYDKGQGETEYTYLGWGAGKHKCTGMRFAKLETTIAVASLLLCFDIRTTDDKGRPYSLQDVPLPDLSQYHWRSPTKPMRVRVKRRTDV